MAQGHNVIHLIADSDINWEKLIPFGIFIVIWVGAAISSAIKKISQQAARNRALRPAPTHPAGSPTARSAFRALARKPIATRQAKRAPQSTQPRITAPARPRIDRTAPAIVQQAQALAQMWAPVEEVPFARVEQPIAQPQPRAVPEYRPPVSTVSAIEARTIEAQRVSDARSDSSSEGGISTGASAGGPKVTARKLNAWLRPPTLREQFILTEIFQPPLALRPPNHIS